MSKNTTRSRISTKRILVLAANPRKNSFTHHLANTYFQSAATQFDVTFLDLAEMDFNPDLSRGYDAEHTLEPSLKSFQDALEWCDHFVIFTPIWWGALPAKFKGLIDRTFLPGFAFQYEKGSPIPKKLLSGKTARVVMTMDTPPWYYVLFQGSAALKQLKTATLKFVGFHSIKSNMIGPIISSNEYTREAWANRMDKLGRNGL